MMGLGAFGSIVVYMLVGMLFLVPGAFLVYREKNKTKDKRNGTLLVTGIVLVVIGVVLCGGAGMGFLATGIATAAE